MVEAAVQRSAPLARLTPMGTSVLLEGMFQRPPGRLEGER
jgi:hypothetical protein